MIHILIVEDEEAMQATLAIAFRQLLAQFPGALVTLASTLEQGIDYVKRQPSPELAIVDLTLPGSTWQNTLSHIGEFDDRSATVIVTGHSELAVRELLSRPTIPIVHKDGSMWKCIIMAAVTALHQRSENLVASAQKLKEAKEIFANASAA